MAQPGCKWTEDDEGNWTPDCGGAWTFPTAGPWANGAKFCCRCGKPLEEVPYEPPQDVLDPEGNDLDWKARG